MGVLLTVIASLLGLFAAVSLAQPLLPPGGIHSATIIGRGNQVITNKYGQLASIPVIKLQLDSGQTFTVESTPLARLARRVGVPLNVQAQVDSSGFPKRIRYHGMWYGAAPPVWFWLLFGGVLAAVAGVLGRSGLRWARNPRLAMA
ncbi:MAG: hypothetical protein ACR2L9_13215 [Solirubrobacteraceae bacterium]